MIKYYTIKSKADSYSSGYMLIKQESKNLFNIMSTNDGIYCHIWTTHIDKHQHDHLLKREDLIIKEIKEEEVVLMDGFSRLVLNQ